MDVGTPEWWEAVRHWYFQRDEGLSALRRGDIAKADVFFEAALTKAPSGIHRSLSLVDSATTRELHGRPEESEQLFRAAFAEARTACLSQRHFEVISSDLEQNKYLEIEQACLVAIAAWSQRIGTGSRASDFPFVAIFRLLAVFARRESRVSDAERWESEAKSIERGTIGFDGGFCQ